MGYDNNLALEKIFPHLPCFAPANNNFLPFKTKFYAHSLVVFTNHSEVTDKYNL